MAHDGNRLLSEALASCRGGAGALLLFSGGINLLMLTAPLYMIQVFDRVLQSRSEETLVLLSVMAFIAVATMGALDAVRSNIMIRVSNWLDRRLAGPLLSSSIAGQLREGRTATAQGLRDLSTVRSFLTGPAVFPILDAPWTPIFVAVIFILHPVLGWVALGGALVLFSLALLNERATNRLLQEAGGASIRALQQAEAAVRNASVIEAMGMMPDLVRRWQDQNREAIDRQSRASVRAGSITATSKFIRMGLQIGIMGAGAWLVIQGELMPGAMIAASILMGRALAPVEQAIGSWKQAVAARASYRRMKQQLADLPSRGDALALPRPEGRLSVENVSYVYPGAEKPVLRNVTFHLEPGESLGLIGPSAAGKSTLAELLVGNVRPAAGHVRLDGADLARWDPQDKGAHLGYLPQDVELFSGRVRDNIARMAEGDAQQVIEAAQLAGVHEMVLRFPAGYETPIGPGGAALSGGERQRVGLARAVYGIPRFVVLDEPNASLDAEGEKVLLSSMETLRQLNVTLVVIAHRPSILRHVDKILVLREGTVSLFGPRDEIIPKVSGPEPTKTASAGVVAGQRTGA